MIKIKLVKFDLCLDHGEASVRVYMDSSLVELGAKAFSIDRPGYSSPCLGEQGWQASENRFALQIDPIIREAFFMPQGIHSLLDQSTNYRLVFFNALLVPVAEGVMRMKGGLGRRRSPTMAPAAHATLSSSYGLNASKGEIDVAATSFLDSSVSRDIRSSPGGDASPIAAPAISEKLPDTQVEPKFLASITRGESASHPEIRARAVPSKCRNPGCGASIVSTMRICPFCGSAQ